MAKTEKVIRINVPFRVLPESLEQLKELAESDDRTTASMFEKLVKKEHQKLFGAKKKTKTS